MPAALSPNIVSSAKVLRLNGFSYEQIAKTLGMSVSTAFKHSKDTKQLPKADRVDPMKQVMKLLGDPNFPYANIEDIAELIKDKDYYIEQYVRGKRFFHPELLALNELTELMEVPTDYVSDLNQEDWYNYYIAPYMFRGVSRTLSKTQVNINKFLDSHQFGMVEVFRKAGKTVLCVGRLTRKINENREHNYAVQSEIIDRSRDRVMAVRSHLKSNPRLIADYGYLPHDKKYRNDTALWKNGEFVIKRDTIQTDPTLKALSWKDAKMLGGHFHGVYFDDPWSIKLEENNEVNSEKWFRWYDSTLVGSMEDNSWQHITCTRKGLYDIYRKLEDRGVFAVFKQPAVLEYPSEYEYIKEGGRIVGVDIKSNDWAITDDCNGRITIEFLLMQKAQMSESAWEMEYQLTPLPSKGRLFNWNDLNFVTWDEIDHKYGIFKEGVLQKGTGRAHFFKMSKVYGAMDMAFGKSASAHYTALVICAYFNGGYYLLNAYLRKGTSKIQKAEMVAHAKRDYPTFSRLFIEADMFQSVYVEELADLIGGVRVEPVLARHEEKTVGKEEIAKLSKKHTRIYNQLDEPIESNSVYIFKSMRHFDEFEREYKEYPRSQYDDLMDAFGSCISKLRKARGKIWGISG